MDGLNHQGYNLYTDDYYTSPHLYSELYKKGVNACGMVRVNRKGFPKDLVHTRKDVERGYYDYRSDVPLLATVWFDRRFIYFLSTMPSTVTVTRRKQDGTQEAFVCPPLLSKVYAGS